MGLALCTRGTLGKGTLRMYPPSRVPTCTGYTKHNFLNRSLVCLLCASMNSRCCHGWLPFATNSLNRSLVQAFLSSAPLLSSSKDKEPTTFLMMSQTLVHLSKKQDRIKYRSKYHPTLLHKTGYIHFGIVCSGETQDDSTSGIYRSERRRTCPDGPWQILEKLPPPVQSHDLILNCLRTKVGSSISVKDHQEKNLVSLHHLKGILNQENVHMLSIVWMHPRTKIVFHTSNLEQ